jgi:hypothetical protein
MVSEIMANIAPAATAIMSKIHAMSKIFERFGNDNACTEKSTNYLS